MRSWRGFHGLLIAAFYFQVGKEATLLGFVGAPFSLATYIIEGGTTATYQKTKDMIYTQPELIKELCSKLADSLADYIRYQVLDRLESYARLA